MDAPAPTPITYRIRLRKKGKTYLADAFCFEFVRKAKVEGRRVNYCPNSAANFPYFVCEVTEIVESADGFVAILDIVEERDHRPL